MKTLRSFLVGLTVVIVVISGSGLAYVACKLWPHISLHLQDCILTIVAYAILVLVAGAFCVGLGHVILYRDED